MPCRPPLRLPCRLILTAALAAALYPLHAQQTAGRALQSRTSEDQSRLTTLRARAKLVAIDIVVSGKDRAPVHGLKQTDFTIFEDKASQAIKSFEEHSGLTSAQALTFPPIPNECEMEG